MRKHRDNARSQHRLTLRERWLHPFRTRASRGGAHADRTPRRPRHRRGDVTFLAPVALEHNDVRVLQFVPLEERAEGIFGTARVAAGHYVSVIVPLAAITIMRS